MKAKVVKGINLENKESDIYMVMIQREKGKRFNVGLLDDSGDKPYFSYHKEEAEEKVRRLNIQFEAMQW